MLRFKSLLYISKQRKNNVIRNSSRTVWPWNFRNLHYYSANNKKCQERATRIINSNKDKIFNWIKTCFSEYTVIQRVSAEIDFPLSRFPGLSLSLPWAPSGHDRSRALSFKHIRYILRLEGSFWMDPLRKVERPVNLRCNHILVRGLLVKNCRLTV